MLLCHSHFTTDFDNAKISSPSKPTPSSRVKNFKHKIFAPASPAFSSRAATSSSTARKSSLRASETGMGNLLNDFSFSNDLCDI